MICWCSTAEDDSMHTHNRLQYQHGAAQPMTSTIVMLVQWHYSMPGGAHREDAKQKQDDVTIPEQSKPERGLGT